MAVALGVLLGAAGAPDSLAQQRPAGQSATTAPVLAGQGPTYADLADLADGAEVIAKVQIRKIAEVEPERARGLRAAWARLYIEARTEAVLGGRTALGEAVRYLVDVPRDAKGKVPKLSKRSVVLFARAVPGRPGELQLVTPDAQVLWDAPLEVRVRTLLAEFYAPAAPQRVTGLREAIHVPGALAGESETQLFLTTASGEPAAVTVARTPGQPVRWSVSFSDVVDPAAPPPRAETLAWYRLACFLPRQFPTGVLVPGAPEQRQAALRDYRFVLEQLGPCPRLRAAAR